ncbi:hypothetical protein BH10ACI1_BH10ACI1_26100 [soil metagenome]
MKVRISSFIVILLMVVSGFTFTATANETAAKGANGAEYNVKSAGYLLLPKTNTEWCTVWLSNPRSNLNVRDANGRVVTKLRHGTAVYVDTYDGGYSRISVKRRGRLVVLGWVASEYLSC